MTPGMRRRRGPRGAEAGWLFCSIVALAGGIGLFVVLFAMRPEVFYLMLAPVALAFYLAPSAFCFRKYRKARAKRRGKPGPPPAAPFGIGGPPAGGGGLEEPGEDGGPEGPPDEGGPGEPPGEGGGPEGPPDEGGAPPERN